MIRIRDIVMPAEHNPHQLGYEAAQLLGISASKVRNIKLVRRSVDARKKPEVKIVYTVDVAVEGNEQKLLKASGCKKVTIPTVFTTAPSVRKEFEKTADYKRLTEMGVVLSSICPLMYMNNPLAGKMPVITCSNKLRTYTTARFYTEDEILVKITKGGN